MTSHAAAHTNNGSPPRRALVTGGSGALGSAICHRLAQQGFHVIVHGHRNAQRAEALADTLCSGGASAEPSVFDVTDAEQCRCAIEALAAAGPIQVIVNNAGVHDDAPLAGMSETQWRHVIDVTLHGFFNVTQPLLLPMIRTRWGRIVNISSVTGVTGNRGQANYAAAKAGLHGATKSLALELATRGITVNAVAPGFVSAGMAQDIAADVVSAAVPMKRAGTAGEVAALVGFLVSDEAAYVTGQVLGINGGMA